MSETPTTGPTRPQARETRLRIDLGDRYYSALAKLAERIDILLVHVEIQADANVVSSLDDLLGAIYSLVLARQYCFDDRPDRPIQLDVVSRRARQVRDGDVRLDGKWIAGWYFNSALFRLAAVYPRLLKVVSGDPQSKKPVPVLLEKVEEVHHTRRHTGWGHANTAAIHREVNTLKHSSGGVHDGRAASYQQGVSAVEELLTLLEMWASEFVPAGTRQK